MTAPTVSRTGSGPRYHEVMEEHSGTHWWYRSRLALAHQILAGRVPAGRPALDLGCGAGAMLTELGEQGAQPAVGTDLEEAIVAVASTRAPGRVVVSSAEAVPIASGSMGCVTVMDVLEHLDDPLAALAECRRVLRPDGLLLVTVPAYQRLWSAHDDWAGHRRRYSRRNLRSTLELAGFRVEWLTAYQSFLVPLAALVRCTPLRRVLGVGDEEAASDRTAVDRLLSLLAALERWLLRRTTIPVGLSIAALATPGTD